MEITNIADCIKAKIEELEGYKNKLRTLGDTRDIEAAKYEKELAKTIIRMRNGDTVTIEEQEITNAPVSVIEKIAKGVCWKQKLTSDFADTAYRNVQKQSDMTEAQLNGYQSIYKHLGVN